MNQNQPRKRRNLSPRNKNLDLRCVYLYTAVNMRTTEIAAKLNIGHGTVYRILDEYGVDYPHNKDHPIYVVRCEECKFHNNCDIEQWEVKYCGKGKRNAE